MNRRVDLIFWKGHHRLRNILREHPVWAEHKGAAALVDGAIVEFGTDGVFRWIRMPDGINQGTERAPDPVAYALNWADYRLRNKWRPASEDIFDDHNFWSEDGFLYLEFLDDPRWIGFVSYKDPKSTPYGEGPYLHLIVFPRKEDDPATKGMGFIDLYLLAPRSLK